jgi:hypothetical protein
MAPVSPRVCSALEKLADWVVLVRDCLARGEYDADGLVAAAYETELLAYKFKVAALAEATTTDNEEVRPCASGSYCQGPSAGA